MSSGLGVRSDTCRSSAPGLTTSNNDQSNAELTPERMVSNRSASKAAIPHDPADLQLGALDLVDLGGGASPVSAPHDLEIGLNRGPEVFLLVEHSLL
jgi:hypothetical protein